MNLQIRNPRASELARQLAALRRVSVTDAVIAALEADVARHSTPEARLAALVELQDDLLRMSKPGGHKMTKEEIDDMWGHPSDVVAT